MIYASIVKINPDEDNEETNHPGLPFPLEELQGGVNMDSDFHARKPIAEFELIKTTKFSSISKAFSRSYDLLTGKDDDSLAVILHKSSIETDEFVDILTLNEGKSVQRTYLQNPLKKLTRQRRRRVAQGDLSLQMSITPALRSQLYAMISAHKADKSLIKLFALKDEQQPTLYKWEGDAFPKGVTTMNPQQAQKLIKNVLNTAKLPWIKVNFLESAKSCSFSLKLKKGGKGISADSGSDNEDLDISFGRKEPDNYDDLGSIQSPKEYVSISNMEFNFAMNWGLNPYVILHELAHYIQFCTPTKYVLNQGKMPLSFKTYQNLFAGHGASFTGVFARLLIDFAYIDEKDLHRSLDAANLQYIHLKDISPDAVDEAIEDFIENKQ
jgi:hypothetical protein